MTFFIMFVQVNFGRSFCPEFHSLVFPFGQLTATQVALSAPGTIVVLRCYRCGRQSRARALVRGTSLSIDRKRWAKDKEQQQNIILCAKYIIHAKCAAIRGASILFQQASVYRHQHPYPRTPCLKPPSNQDFTLFAI